MIKLIEESKSNQGSASKSKTGRVQSLPNHSIANTDLIEDTNWNKKNYYKDQSIVKGTKI